MLEKVIEKEDISKFFKYEIIKDEKIIARARLYLIFNDLHEQPYALGEDLFVDINYRNQGYGKMLVLKTIEKAKESNCYKIICTTRKKELIKYYDELGFKEHGFELRLDL